MRITSKGQVTIPQHIREQCGFLPGTEVDFVLDADGRVVLVELDHGASTTSRRKTRGGLIVDQIRGRLGPSPISTDEYMALIRGYDEDDDDPGFQTSTAAEVA